MSYCRWSSDNWQCDVYAWADVAGGWRIALAGRKYAREPLPRPEYGKPGWAEQHQANLEALTTIDMVDLELPHAGEVIACPDLESFRAKLVELREIGYRFPDYVLERIDEEAEGGVWQ